MNNFIDDVAEFNLSVQKITLYKNLKLWYGRWEEELYRNKVSPRTLNSYRFAVNTFLDFAKRNRNVPMEGISVKFINRYLIDYQIKIARLKAGEGLLEKEAVLQIEKESKLNNIGKNDANFTVHESFENTLSQRITILKMFLKFITENNKEQHDYTKLFDKLARIKIQDKFTDYLTVSELEEVVKYMQIWVEIYKDHKPKCSLRNAYRDAFLMLIYALTGARSDEVVHIKLQDISLFKKDGKERYIIKIEKGKGGKKRSVSVKKEYLHKFVDYFSKELPNSTYYISSTYKKGYTNAPMNPNTIRVFSNNILKNIGINKTGLHAFRRGYVTKRIGNDDVDISIVAKEVGNTTAILEKHYLKHTAEAFLR